jgi:hypothetical protein
MRPDFTGTRMSLHDLHGEAALTRSPKEPVMNLTSRIVRFAAACLVLTLAACGGGGDDGGGGGTPPAGTVVGAAGGTVVGPNGAKVVIPPGALANDTTINIAQIATSATALPAGFTAHGQMFAFTPHGTTFAVPVTMTLPFDTASVPAGTTPQLYKTNAQNQWQQVAGATFGADSVSAQVTSFSDVTVVIPPLVSGGPVRVWEFGGFPGDGGAEVSFGSATQVGGLLEQVVSFGLGSADFPIVTFTQSIPADGTARGYIFGTPDGLTYGVYAEAPFAKLGNSLPIGSIARLKQTQSFIKLAADATLTFTPTKALVSGGDFNLFAPSVGFTDTSIKAEIFLGIRAYTQNRTFFHTEGGAMVTGSRDGWTPEVWNYRVSRTPFWTEADFVFTQLALNHPVFGSGTRGDLEFTSSRSFTVDLSTIAVGEEFSLQSETFARADNRRGGGAPNDHQASAANAFMRDPLSMDGTTLAFTGLQPTNNPVLVPPVELPIEPASCVPGPGPDPLAGVLQFSAASYSIGEFAGAAPPVRVTRSGGSKGAVTATFTTSDGTAIAGADYTPVNATVFFADGDAAPRAVTVPTIQNQVVAPDKTVNLTLSQPGGCAALGTQTTAVLTIRDDIVPPPPPPRFTIGGTVSGLGGAQVTLVLQLPTIGESLSVGDGRFTFTPLAATGSSYSVRVATQPTNTVCTVTNGTGTVTNANVASVGVDCVAAVAQGLPARRRSPGNS